MKEFESKCEQPEVIIDWPNLEVGEQYQRIIDYTDGECSTQVFRYNGTIVDESGKVGIDVTFEFGNGLNVTKQVSPDTIGLNGPIDISERQRIVRDLLPPDQ